MKKIFSYLLALSFGISAAQEITESVDLVTYTLNDVRTMAIYPGCEKINSSNKDALTRCLSENLNANISKRIQPFIVQFEKEGFVKAASKIRFVISKEGKIERIYPLQRKHHISEIESKLDQISVQIFENISKNIKRIEPAKLENSEAVDLQFDLPIKFSVATEANLKFKWKEFIILSLKTSEFHYEIRKNKNENSLYKIYEIKDGKEFYLDKSNSLEDILSMKPYDKIREEPEGNLMVDRVINGKHFKIYYHPESSSILEIYEIQNGVNKLRESITFEQIKFSELYMRALVR